MRVNTRVTWDIESGAILERESFDYRGPIESCDPATIIGIIGLALSGATTGYSLANRPGTPKPASTVPPPGVTALQNTATQNAQKAAIGRETPNIIGETSGLANPEYVASIAQTLAGTAGQSGSSGAARDAIARAFGLPAGGGTAPGTQNTATSNFVPAGTGSSGEAPAPGQTNLSDFVTQFLYK